MLLLILKKQKPLDIMNAIQVERNSIHQSMGSKKNFKIPRETIVPKIGYFLPIVSILTALRALGCLASGGAPLQKRLIMGEWIMKTWRRKSPTTRKLKVLL